MKKEITLEDCYLHPSRPGIWIRDITKDGKPGMRRIGTQKGKMRRDCVTSITEECFLKFMLPLVTTVNSLISRVNSMEK